MWCRWIFDGIESRLLRFDNHTILIKQCAIRKENKDQRVYNTEYSFAKNYFYCLEKKRKASSELSRNRDSKIEVWCFFTLFFLSLRSTLLRASSTTSTITTMCTAAAPLQCPCACYPALCSPLRQQNTIKETFSYAHTTGLRGVPTNTVLVGLCVCGDG